MEVQRAREWRGSFPLIRGTVLICLRFQIGGDVYDFAGDPEFSLPTFESVFAKNDEMVAW